MRKNNNKRKRIAIGAVCAAVILAGAGAGYYRYTLDLAIAETDRQTKPSPEDEIGTKAQAEPDTKEETTAGKPTEETLAEKETKERDSSKKETKEKDSSEKETLEKETSEKETIKEKPTEKATEKPQPETGSVKSGELPPSAEYFIISEDADQFFKKSVFIGDSVMMGFRNYVMGQPAGFLGAPEFLVSGSFSVRMALNTISKDTIHPIYQGEQRYIWDSISMMGAKKVFLLFGLNDIGMEGVDGTCENYLAVIDKIKEVNPEADIYVISTTNMLTGSEKGSLNNENIRLLNQKMKQYCDGGAAEYIDITSFLIGEDGGLKAEFCSDEYVHQTYAAYDIWTQVLRNYASGGKYLFELETEPETEEGTEEAGTDTEQEGETNEHSI